MRLLLLATIAAIAGDWLLTRTPTLCQVAGHDPHWSRCGTVRECARCHHIWLRSEPTDIGFTTTTQDPIDGRTEAW